MISPLFAIILALSFPKALSDKMKTNKISKVVFDRNGYIYHGRVKAFAEELRQNGINF